MNINSILSTLETKFSREGVKKHADFCLKKAETADMSTKRCFLRLSKTEIYLENVDFSFIVQYHVGFIRL